MEKGVGRNSRVELLRIMSMVMIVAHHYALFGFLSEELAFSRNKLFVDIFGMWAHVGVDLFVLISGYYMVSGRFRLKKLLVFMGSVWFYSLGIPLAFRLAGVPIGLAQLRSAALPLLTSQYWFASYYALLLLFSPFLNAGIRALDRRGHALLCLLLLVLVTLLPAFPHITFAGGILPLFVMLYLCGAWCRLYVPAADRTARRCLLLGLGLCLLCVLRVVFVDVRAARLGDLQALESSVNFLQKSGPLTVAVSAALLLAGTCGRAGHNRVIVRLGGLCFGVYLFHANPYLSSVVWQRVFHTAGMVDSPWLFVHALGTVGALFAAGCAVERLRQLTAARLWEKLVDALLPPLERLLAAAWQRFSRLTGSLLGLR